MDLAIIYGLLAAVAWGINDFFIMLSIRKKADVYGILFFVQIISVVMFLPSLLSGIPQLPIETWGVLAIAGFLMAIGYIFYAKGMVIEKLSVMATLSGGEGAITVILGILVLAEMLTGMKGIGVILVFGGITALSIEKLEDMRQIAKGASLGVGAMASFGVKSFLYAVAARQMDAVLAVLGVHAVAAVVMSALVAGKLGKVWDTLRAAPWQIVGAGVFNALGFYFAAMGYQNGSVPIVATVAALYPAVCILLAAIFLKEKLRVHQYGGAVAVLVGLVLISL